MHKLDLTHIELSNTLDLEALADLSRRLSLSFGKDDVDQIVGLWDLGDSFEVVGTLYCCHSSDDL